jgi:hypothetical protein
MADEYTEEVRSSLQRVQIEELADIGQRARLGERLNFEAVIPSLQKITGLFSSIDEMYIGQLPFQHQKIVLDNANAFFHQIESIRKFDETQSNPHSARQRIIDSVEGAYEHYFNHLLPVISFISSRSRDFAVFEREARSKIQAISDKADAQIKVLEGIVSDASRVLEDVRRLAFESGVSAQAKYFKEEADNHDKDAKIWAKRTFIAVIIVLIFGLGSLFVHKIPILRPDSIFDAVALGTSKIFIFVILSYLVFLAAKNFLSHKHNAIINRHRLNALQTFNALVDASSSVENRDVILSYAASCIFAPQETGYARSSVPLDHSPSILQALPRVTATAP